MAKVKHCKAWVMKLYGNTTIEFDTKAETRKGILKAAGRAVARQLGDDAISVTSIEYKTGKPNAWSRELIRPSLYEDMHIVFKTARDELFNLRYA